MGTELHTLSPNEGATRPKKRVGRGRGSRTGKTAGRGQKGQKSRSGSGGKVGFEGGQMPMARRLPKRGFKNIFRKEWHPINLGLLAQRFDGSSVVDVDALRAAGLVPRKATLVKILGSGDLTTKLDIRAHGFSKSALEKIQALGGTAEVMSTKPVKSADA